MRSWLVVVLVLVLSSSTLALQNSAAGEHPGYSGPTSYGEQPALNVVVIIVDDLGVDQVASYSSNYPCPGCGPLSAPIPCTPNLDALASEGVRFTNVWSSPVCTPTRAQILTGKRCSSLGIGRATKPLLPRNGMDPDEVTLGDLIPLNGFFGKWHLADPAQVPGHPLDCGFFPFAGSMWNLGPPPQDGPSYYDWQKYDGVTPSVQTFDYATTETTDDAIEWIDQLDTGAGPWCVVVSYHASHSPYHCPQGPVASNHCPTDWWADCFLNCQNTPGVCRSRAMTQVLDHELGRLLECVDRSDTAVLLVGDNGTEAVATAEPFQPQHSKGTLHQGGINVPMFALAPGLAAGENHELIQVADLFSTVLDLTVTPVPVGIAGLDSVSLAQYVSPAHAAPGSSPRKAVSSEVFEPNFMPEDGAFPADYVAEYHDLAIRDERFKLIEKNTLVGGRSHQFYRLHDPSPEAPPLPQDPAVTPDPHELVDLMPLQASWAPAVQQAYDGLVARLDAYQHLPLSTAVLIEAAVLQEAAETVFGSNVTTTCDDRVVRVGWQPGEGGQITSRAFLDFDISDLPENLDVVQLELELDLETGFLGGASQLSVRALDVPGAATPCATLYDSAGVGTYGTASGLVKPNPITIQLGPLAVAGLEQAAAAGASTFSMALVYAGEGSVPDMLRLDPLPAFTGLRVTYGLEP